VWNIRTREARRVTTKQLSRKLPRGPLTARFYSPDAGHADALRHDEPNLYHSVGAYPHDGDGHAVWLRHSGLTLRGGKPGSSDKDAGGANSLFADRRQSFAGERVFSSS
jgi:hypothetical protein